MNKILRNERFVGVVGTCFIKVYDFCVMIFLDWAVETNFLSIFRSFLFRFSTVMTEPYQFYEPIKQENGLDLQRNVFLTE